MSQLTDIRMAQDKLEESFSKRMAELEAQLNVGGPAKDTVAKVAEEFRTFRELMFSMLGLLRKQVNECCRSIDAIETRQRRKALIFHGIPEADNEDCRALVLKTVSSLELPMITASDVGVCHRLGASAKDHHRPILAWFSGMEARAAIWRAKTKLKGTRVSIKEFLTQARQAVFSKARQHFGMRACWTQDGVVVVRTPDGSRHKFVTSEELGVLTAKYAKPSSSSGSKSSVGNAGVPLVPPKRK